jgi:hypothetical protein
MSSWYEQEVEPNAKQLRQWLRVLNGEPISTVTVDGVRYTSVTHSRPENLNMLPVSFLGTNESGERVLFPAKEENHYRWRRG